VATTATLAIIAFAAAFLIARYPALPDLLPVRFSRRGAPNGWQFKTMARVLTPAFVQTALALTLGSIGALVLSRSHGTHDQNATDVKTASVAAECVALMTLIVAFRRIRRGANPWERGVGARTSILRRAARVVLTIGVAIRARRQFGQPANRPFVAGIGGSASSQERRRPALFVHKGRFPLTLNFGRPVAVLLMALILESA
jgi:uncharacterized membrane protein